VTDDHPSERAEVHAAEFPVSSFRFLVSSFRFLASGRGPRYFGGLQSGRLLSFQFPVSSF